MSHVARYYTESLNGRIREVVAQDETGLYSGSVFKTGADAPMLRTILWQPPSMIRVKLPEWPGPRDVSTTSLEYLECVRRVERGSYTVTIPSEVMEFPGTAEDAISEVLGQADPSKVVIIETPARVR